jgi:hypothetical protein
MAYSLPTSIDTAQDYIPALTGAATVKMPRVAQQFATMAELAAGIAKERANIGLGLPVWTAGQIISVATEWPAARRWAIGATGALSHARECVLPSGKVITLATDAATVATTVGMPGAGVGATDDVHHDPIGNAYYTKVAGAWQFTGPLVALGARITDSVSRTITAADNGQFLAPTGAITYTIPAGLTPMPSFTVDCPAAGAVSIARSGAATINGAGTVLTRTRAANPVGFVVLAHADADAYGVSGA